MKTRIYDWNANFAYAPPAVEAVIATEQIVSIHRAYSDRIGSVLRLTLTDGRTVDCDGKIEDFLPAQP